MKLRVKNERIKFDKLKKSKKSFRILHISDLHSNHCREMNADVWKQSEKLDFDIAAITGDMILNTIDELYPHYEGIKKLAKRAPVFFVDGNHDAFFTKSIAALLSKAGVRVVYNKAENITINGADITIVGFSDYWRLENRQFKDVAAVFENVDFKRFVIVLQHQPQLIKRVSEYSPDLMLSGHTHGGQLRLPFLPVLYAPGQGILPKYGEGLYTVKRTRLYISTGIGTTHFSLRTFVPPSVSIVEAGY